MNTKPFTTISEPTAEIQPRANLAGADLSNTDLTGADLKDADLAGGDQDDIAADDNHK